MTCVYGHYKLTDWTAWYFTHKTNKLLGTSHAYYNLKAVSPLYKRNTPGKIMLAVRKEFFHSIDGQRP